MANYERKKHKYAAKGVSLRFPPDLMPEGLYPKLVNVQPRILGGLEPRGGIENYGNPTLPDAIHSLRRLNDPTDDSFAVLIGAGTSVFDQTSATAIVSGFAGTPLSMVQYRPTQTPRPWMYVSDAQKSVKIRTDREFANVGIAPEGFDQAVVVPDIPIYRFVSIFDAPGDWTPGGTAGAVSTFSRFSTTIATIVYYNLAGLNVGQCSIVPTAVTQNFQQGADIFVNSLEYIKIAEVFEPIVDTTIASIIYDSGTTGGCSIVLTNQSTGLRMNALVVLNAGGGTAETVRVESVTFGANQQACFRCTTTNAHLASEPVEGRMSFRTWTGNTFAAGNTLVGNAIQSTITVGTGTLTSPITVDLANINGNPTNQNDYVHISLRLSAPVNLTEGRVTLDIDSTTNDFQHNALYKTFRASDVQTNVSGTQTAQEAGTAALQQVTIDRKAFNLLSEQQQQALLERQRQSNIGFAGIFRTTTLSVAELTALGITEAQLAAESATKFSPSSKINAIPTDKAFGGLDTNPNVFPASAQSAAGDAQWTELIFRVGDMTRIGTDPSVSLADVKSVQISLQVSGSVTVVCDSMWLGGTKGPDNPTTAPYLWTYRYRDSTTGAKSNPAPILRSGWIVYREAMIVRGAVSPDPQVDTVDIFRFGGSIPSWRWVGSHPNTSNVFFTDTQSDSDISLNEELSFTNFQPFPVPDLPRSGTCNVSGTSVSWVSGDTFNTAWANGSEILINGVPTSIYGSPPTSTFLQLQTNMGAANAVTFSLPDATIPATPFPGLWGPDPLTGVMYACGDGTGFLYWTNPNDPDSASDAGNLEVCSPSEQLQNGFMWNGQCFVFSTERLFRINPTGQGNYIAQEVPNAEGLYGKYAFAVGPNQFWWVSRHGVQESNGSNVDSITNESLYPLFPHDGQAGEQIFDYLAFDMTNQDAIRLFYTRDSLYLVTPTISPSECPTGGITARIPLVGSSGQLVELDDVETDYFVTSIHFDPANYPGLSQLWWQTFIQTFSGPTPTYTYDLVDENGTVYDSHTVADNISLPTMQDLRPFTPDLNNAHDYMIRMRAVATASGELVIRRWQMFVDVVDSTRVELQIPLAFYNEGSGGGFGSAALNNYEAYGIRFSNASSNVDLVTLWLLERAKNVGATISYQLSAIAALDLDGGAANTADIYYSNYTSSNPVTESLIEVTTETPTRYTQEWDPDDAAEFVDEDEFQLQVDFSRLVTTQDLLVYKAVLHVFIDCPTHMQMHYNTQNDCQSTATGTPRIRYETSARLTIDSTKYEPGVLWYMDATGSVGVTDRTDGTTRLLDTGTDVSGTAGSLISGSTLSVFPNYPLYDRQRTGNLTLVDGNNVMNIHDDGNLSGQPSIVVNGVTYLISEVERT